MDNIDQNQEFKYENKTLVLLPGSFKPPHKGHWQMVLDNLPIADEIHIFISNTSTKYISNRKLSLSNLKKLGKLKQFAEENLNSEEITKIFNELDEQIDNLTFNRLKEKLNELLSLNYADDEVSQEFKSQVQTYLKELEEKLFKSIRYTAAGTEILPETAEEIFNMYIKDYNVQDKVFVHISQAASPMLAAVGFANNNCLDCDLFIGSHTEDEANERSKQLEQLTKAFAYNPSNRIHLLPVSEKIQAARDIRANINNLNKNMFPEKITDETYNKILELLTNNIMEKTIKKDKFTLLFESFMHDLLNEGRKCI